MASLVITLGARRWEVALEEDGLRAGSGPSCRLVLADAAVSREHLEFKRAGGGWKVVDLESATGTRVNGGFVNQRALAEGDVIEVGGARLEYRAGPLAAGAPVPAPLGEPAPEPAPSPAFRPVPAVPVAAAATPSAAPVPAAPAAAPPAATFAPRPAGAPRAAGGARRATPVASRARSSGGTPPWFAVATLGLVALAALFVFNSGGERHRNQTLLMRLEAHQQKFEYDAMIALERDVDPTEALYGDPARAKIALAKGALAEQRQALLEQESIRFLEWQIRKFHQDNRGDTKGLIARYDEYLDKFPNTSGWADVADKRLKLAGAPSPAALRAPPARGDLPAGSAPAAPAGASPGALLNAASEEADRLEAKERFGDALAVYDRFASNAGSTLSAADAEAFRSQMEKRKAKVVKAAEAAFEQMELKAFTLSESGSIAEAEALYKRACETYGIDGLVDRAKFQLDELRKRRR
jgi:hypothetical protein